jgi:hypothetical protein
VLNGVALRWVALGRVVLCPSLFIYSSSFLSLSLFPLSIQPSFCPPTHLCGILYLSIFDGFDWLEKEGQPIQIQTSEIEACKWMPLKEFLGLPYYKGNATFATLIRSHTLTLILTRILALILILILTITLTLTPP